MPETREIIVFGYDNAINTCAALVWSNYDISCHRESSCDSEEKGIAYIIEFCQS